MTNNSRLYTGVENGTSLGAQVIMFVRISGFSDTGIKLPKHLRNPKNNGDDAVFALVRWLTPHPNASLRDKQLRPVCPPPFDINHCLWQFAKITPSRPSMTRRSVTNQLNLFPGENVDKRRANATTQKWARYDFVEIQSIDTFMNCTVIDGGSAIMETVTLPFCE